MLPYRVLRAAKNRYGSTNEIGMFDMTGTGLKVIENPSKLLLEGRPIGVGIVLHARWKERVLFCRRFRRW